MASRLPFFCLPSVRARPPLGLVIRGNDTTRTNISPTELAADLALLLPDDTSRLFEPGQPLPGWLGEVGVKDAAIVPLTTDGLTVGAMVVANRLTEVSSFVEDDLRLFETLANHANVALANGRLVATLQHDAREKAYQALHDPVTGLPNRTMLQERLETAIQDARDNGLGVALVFLDLVTFKEVNDTLGTVTGDRLLVEVRDRIEAVLPEQAQLAQFTGDQFAVLVTGVTDHDFVMGLAETVLAEFDSPVTAGDVSLVLGADLGVAHYPDHAPTAELLLQRADAATYRARQEGSGIEVYASETDPYAPRRLALAADLSEALERGEVDVYVQPKVSLADGFVIGAEALVRWTHPRLGPLAPDQFIPAAEHTGVIRQLTTYVVRDALAQCRSWRDAGLDLDISVNLSGRNLFDTHLVEDIGAAIEEANVPASALTLELTESTVMGESQRSMAVLLGLQELGVRLSVDDFGTGYSSLAHLRSLPITELKIDKSFVMTMTVNDQDAVIVRTLVELGRSLGLRTVAEGVESPDAREMLREYGCVEAQGYLFSRPIPAEHFLPVDRPPAGAPPSRWATRSCRSTATSAGRSATSTRAEPASTSDERPGVAPAGLVHREAPGSYESPGAGPHCVALERVEQLRERVRQLGAGQRVDGLEQIVRDLLTGELPDHGPQLELAVEHQAVVDAADPSVEPEQAVAALAVGVVADEIEGAHRAELGVVGLVLVQGEVVLLEVGLDELLHRSDAEWSVAADRERHEVPAQRLGQLVGGHLSVVQARREVPEGTLAAPRLVDRPHHIVAARDLAEVRGVGAPGHAPQHLHLAVLQCVGSGVVGGH